MRHKARSTFLFIVDVLLNVVVIVVFVLIFRAYLFSPFQVHGPSMCDTFNSFEGECLHGNGEYIMIYKFGYLNVLGWQVGLPERGDVVVFHPPGEDSSDFFIKRVIGLPGEKIEFRNGQVFLYNDNYQNGVFLDETFYLNDENAGNTSVPSSRTMFEIPEGSYFVMGDNRRASSDSRRCFQQSGCGQSGTPFITLNEIQGRAFVVLWPLNRFGLVPRGAYDLLKE